VGTVRWQGLQQRVQGLHSGRANGNPALLPALAPAHHDDANVQLKIVAVQTRDLPYPQPAPVENLEYCAIPCRQSRLFDQLIGLGHGDIIR
jgi:hypothetical protein